MQGDIYQLNAMSNQILPPAKGRTVIIPQPTQKNNNNPFAHIYNEDDLSHYLYVDPEHPDTPDRFIINDVSHGAPLTPLESPFTDDAHTPPSETHETPMFSDCESDFDEPMSAHSSSSYLDHHHVQKRVEFEDGFEFPIFLGRQADEEEEEDEEEAALPSKPTRPALRSAPPAPVYADAWDHPSTTGAKGLATEPQVADLSGPMMSWWPAPLETMEYAGPLARDDKVVEPKCQSVSGPLMTWWPAPIELLEHDWNERFYE
ncbi:hypothetical protein F4778DRAFT_763577 [Xylariomycetidae sp. FL2044]|nr:hypothetical protein F4778DRAFT_763577 [Xylariomycetidae sp. FL2044]